MHTATVAWLHPDGSGAVRVDGAIAHLPGALPGDVVRFPAAARGPVEDWTMLTPSADRRAPSCPHDARCGGCDLSGWRPDARRRALAAMVAHTLQLSEPPALEHTPADTGVRARVSLAIDGHRVGYRPARSHDVIDIGACEIARPEVQRALTAFRAWRHRHPDLNLTHVALRSDGARVVHALTAGGVLSSAQRAALAELGDVALDGRTVHGDPTLRLPVGPLRLTASPGAFYQVHLELNERLVAFVTDAVRAVSPERVLDLYAGIGNLGLPLAHAGVPVLAVERDGPSLRDLRRTADEAGIRGVEVLALDALRFDPSRVAYDVAILDPPRAGADGVLTRVLRNRPRRVVLVSCDLRAARRDVTLARRAGYRLADTRCFDLFPRTHHVETVSVLDR